jgi:hypothetical protein
MPPLVVQVGRQTFNRQRFDSSLWATGTGAEIMRPMAAPVRGGILAVDEIIDLLLPVLFYVVRRRRGKKIHPRESENSA